MENMENINVNETMDNTTDQTADQAAENTEKKFGAGEYAVLASAVVGACTIAVGAYEGLKKGCKTAKSWLKGVRAEVKKRIAEQEKEAEQPAEKSADAEPAPVPEKETEEKKD